MENLNQNQEENNEEVVSTEESVEESLLETQSKENILTKKFPQVWGLVILLVVAVIMSGLYLHTDKQASEIEEVDIQTVNSHENLDKNKNEQLVVGIISKLISEIEYKEEIQIENFTWKEANQSSLVYRKILSLVGNVISVTYTDKAYDFGGFFESQGFQAEYLLNGGDGTSVGQTGYYKEDTVCIVHSEIDREIGSTTYTIKCADGVKDLLVYSEEGSKLMLDESVKIDWSNIENITKNAYAETFLLDKDGNELGLIKQSAHTYPANKGSRDWYISNYWTGSELEGDSQDYKITPGEYKIKLVITSTDPVEKREFISDVFEIYTKWPTISLLNPNGGEVIKLDEEYELSWLYEGEGLEDEFVYFGLRDVNYDVCWFNVEIPISQKSYTFTPSKILCDGSIQALSGGEEFKLQIIVVDFGGGKGLGDLSDDYFVIE
jgi:hypothetical protein